MCIRDRGEDDFIRTDRKYDDLVVNHDYIILKSFQNTIAVSYTHLDVYKRQIQGYQNEKEELGEKQLQDTIEKLKQEYRKKDCVIPVSYTHLCYEIFFPLFFPILRFMKTNVRI